MANAFRASNTVDMSSKNTIYYFFSFMFNYLKISALTLTLGSLFGAQHASAEETDAAPSLHLDYYFDRTEEKTDILVNSLKVNSEFIDSYYSLINGWLWQETENGMVDENSMYCGLQHAGISKNQIRLYSIWNPFIRFKGAGLAGSKETYTLNAQAGDRITAGDLVLYEFKHAETFSVSYSEDVYTITCKDTTLKANDHSYITYDYVLPNVNPATFKGEGRGAQVLEKVYDKSIFEIGNWYTFVTKVWEEETSKFGCWFYDQKNNKWTHYCTLGYPAKNMYYKMHIDAFLENWTPYGRYLRSYDLKDTWARSANGKWEQPVSVTVNGYPDDGKEGGRCRERFNEYNVAVNSDSSINMTTGGGVLNSTYAYGSSFKYPGNKNLTEPAFAKMSLTAVSLCNDTLKWELAEGGLPQFSYTYEVIDAKNGNLIKSSPVKYNSEDRSVVLGLSNNDVEVALTITDIFDNEITVTVVPQYVESPVSASSCAGMLQNVQPNSWGTMVEVPIATSVELMDIKIVDESGSVMASVFNQPQLMHGPYVHNLYINTNNLDANKVYTIKAEVGGKKCSSQFSMKNGMYDAPSTAVVEKDYSIKYVYTNGNQVVARVYASRKTNSVISISTVNNAYFANQRQVMLEPGDNDIVLDANLAHGNVYYFTVLLNGKPSLAQGFVVK